MALFRVHIPILDEVKSKGLKPALRDKADDLITRVTAGLDIADVRGVLRDDPPGRPNPRLKPHAEGFWLHMKPTYYHNLVDGLYPTFRLGWLSTFFFAFEILTGVFLMFYYTPSPLVAYEDMLNLLSNVPFGRLMRDLHKLGAEVMVAVVALHMLRTFVTGSYKKPRQFTWATGVILLGVTVVLSFSGYLLPWDQLSLWAVTIGASMFEAIPPEVVGRAVNLIVRGAPEIGAGGLLRFYLLHIIGLPLVGILALGVHYYKVILHASDTHPRAVLCRRSDGDPGGGGGLLLSRPARASRRYAGDAAAHDCALVFPLGAGHAETGRQGALGADRARSDDRPSSGLAVYRGRAGPALRRPPSRPLDRGLERRRPGRALLHGHPLVRGSDVRRPGGDRRACAPDPPRPAPSGPMGRPGRRDVRSWPVAERPERDAAGAAADLPGGSRARGKP